MYMSIVLLKRNELVNLGYLKKISALVLLRVKGCYLHSTHPASLIQWGFKAFSKLKKIGGFVLDTEILPLQGRAAAEPK